MTLKFTVSLFLDETMRIPLEISSDDTILQVKQKIETTYQVRADSQLLFIGNIQLRDNQRVSECNIFPGDRIRLVRRRNTGDIQVFIIETINNGGSTSIIISPTCTVLDLKKEYNGRTGFPIEHMRLIFRGTQLNDERRLEQDSIVNGSSIHLVARLH